MVVHAEDAFVAFVAVVDEEMLRSVVDFDALTELAFFVRANILVVFLGLLSWGAYFVFLFIF